MPTWWGKSSSKEDKRKASKESFFDAINRKLKITSNEKSTSRSGGSRRHHSDTVSERGFLSRVPSRLLSPSTQVSRCQSFAERPHAQPLPLPVVHHDSVVRTNSGISASTIPGFDRVSRPSLFLPGKVSNKLDPVDAEGDIATASISRDSSIDSDDPSDSRPLSPLTSDYENGQRTAANSPSGIKHMEQLPVLNQDSKVILKPADISFNNQYLSASPKRGPLSNHVQNLQIPQRGAFSSAPDSSMSSPSRSPMRAFGSEQVWNSGACKGKPFSDIAFLGSGHCSSPGSGHNSGHNSVGGDMSGQLFWPQSRCSPECSPIPSPRMTSPGPSSRIHSGAVTPLHPRAAGAATDSPTSRPDDGKKKSHRLPLPPIIISNTCPFSPAYSAATSPSLPRSPGRAESPSSRIHSGAVTPLHPRAAGAATDSPTSRPDDGKKQSHRLPLPPITISNTCPFSPAYSAATSPSLPRSPGRAENPTSPGSRWKKGRLLGRGTFGHVYLGFNSESGEMCAMKEVTLFSDDAKSKESAQQFGQEIMLLSRLRHPNIVQYYGSETVDDKLYIYLEYVSGGSIYKLLQEYGQFGESAIRNYAHQILSGLAYLHAKNTVHRDIKGANILVDPNGHVKLADFGMAKHITGSSCPLSFKGSPYWMAPEVIKNSNGCNLAVDIWSLGCTVLEMATTKPPWSQYEGVAAMFKIGNSKELPAIPDSLSDEGKDFVRQCLQRNPLHRPTAAWLLDHPFVKNAAPLERPIFSADASDPSPAVTNAMRTVGIGNTRNLSCIDSEGTASLPCRGLKMGSGSSDAHTPRNVSCPVSPIGSPLLHPRSPQHLSGRMSPSPISSPHTASGSSTPLTGGSGAIPFHYQKQPMTYLNEGIGVIPRSQNSFHGNASNPYQEPKPDLFQGISQASSVFQEMISLDTGAFGKQYGRPGHGDYKELYDGQPILADHVSQQLLRDHVKLKPSLNLNPSSLMLGRNGGI